MVTQNLFSSWDRNEVGRHRSLILELGEPAQKIASQGVTVLSQRILSVAAEATT